MLFASDIAARGGLEIEQSTPKTGETTQAMIIRDCLWLVGGGPLGTSALDKPTSIVQNSNIALLEIGKFASSKDVAHEIDISQTGTGTINLVYGSSFENSGVITLNQSGGGFINIGGGHSDDVFNTAYKSNNDVAINHLIDDEHYAKKPLHTDGFTSKNTTYVINQTSGTIEICGRKSVGKRNGTPVNALACDANIVCSEAKIGGTVAVESGATFGVILDGTSGKVVAPITVGTGGIWTMESGSNFGLSFSDTYLKSLDSTKEDTTTIGVTDFKFTEQVAKGADINSLLNGFVLANVDERLWSLKDGTKWTQEGTTTYVNGTLIFDHVIELTEGGTVSEVFSDLNDTLTVGLKISDNDVELQGNNTHSFGTVIEGGEGLTVTLGHANALGAGAVSTSGTVTLATSGRIVANLPGTITNTGDLTFTGAYTVDADKLDVVSAQNGLVDAENKFVEAASGDYSNCNGFVAEQKALLLVDQETGAKATFEEGTSITIGDGSIQFSADAVVDGEDVILEGIIEKETATYYINTAEHAVTSGDILEAGDATTVVEMAATAGTLTADESIEVNAKGGTVKLQEETAGPVTVSGCLENTTVESAGGTISADITGTSSVAVTGDTTLSGTNSYSGDTVIDGAELKLASGSSVGTGVVELKSHGTFDMGGNALDNFIKVTGCTLRGAGSYAGDMEVHDELELADATTANKVTLVDAGSLTGSDLTVNELDVQTNGDASVGGSLTINDNGTVTLNNGKVLSVGGSLTLAGATTLTLNGNYAVGTELLSSTGTLTMDLEAVTLVYDDSTVELEQQGNALVLVSKFKQDKADVAAQSNWGIATTSRAFVNTVRGQHSNTGCIANGRGTVWAAAFGAYNDLDGSDIDVKGAAVGVDAKVGSCSTVGIAFGYAEGEVSPTGLRDADQEGEYVALYGSHGLKKLSSTSCLSLDWVAAYGNTESEWNSLKWEQDSLQLNTRLNWNKKVTERLGMSVFGGLEYFATGSDTADGVKSGSIQNLRGEIGVGARYVAWGTPASQPVLDEKGATLAAARPGCEKLVLNGEIRYFNDVVRSNPVIEMDGLRGGGENPGRQGMGIEAGATYRISERWSASANYSFNAMEDSVEHRANVGASYTF